MANIVTQLQNKDGDNLYPLAGGMAADSITTAMIQDGAVTSDKVDFTTYNTSEQVVGTWIDGKPLYRRVISLSSSNLSSGSLSLYYKLPNSTTFDLKIAYGTITASNSGTNSQIELGSIAWQSDNTVQLASRVEKSGDGYITFLATKTINGLVTTGAEIIIEYTKTTD